MNFFIYIEELLGVKTNANQFNWIYGTNPPSQSKTDYDKCEFKLELYITETDKILENKNLKQMNRYNYFYGEENTGKIYYDRVFIFGTRLRYSIEIKSDKHVIMNVNKNYFKFIKYKFMNIHSVGYILSDIFNFLLINSGYLPVYAASVSYQETGLLIYGPPSTGKTLSAINLNNKYKYHFISEDITIIKDCKLLSVPYTNTYRYYDKGAQRKKGTFKEKVKKNIPLFQLIKNNDNKKNNYIKNNMKASSKLKKIFLLNHSYQEENVNAQVTREAIYKKIINLHKYNFKIDNSPTILALEYFNDEINIQKVLKIESDMVDFIIKSSDCYIINSDNPNNFGDLVHQAVTTIKDE